MYKSKEKILIAVDGPAAAGKSTISKIVANKLQINYIDTGSMYRAITLKCLMKNVDIEDKKAVIDIAINSKIDFKEGNIYLDDKIVNDAIREELVSNNVAKVSQIPEVREILVKLQRKTGENASSILDGRDIGSVVFPNADYKFFLIATPEERGNRRYKELKEKGFDVNLDEIIKEIEERDLVDKTRKVSPLIKPVDAIEIDTTGKTIDDIVEYIINIIKK
ncbi:MAG: (d)CMP kinase [Clostridioides sp.]|jgi:cytidylate kinase|nr:(d)CMP kinase [Clostridioides sp.]